MVADLFGGGGGVSGCRLDHAAGLQALEQRQHPWQQLTAASLALTDNHCAVITAISSSWNSTSTHETKPAHEIGIHMGRTGGLARAGCARVGNPRVGCAQVGEAGVEKPWVEKPRVGWARVGEARVGCARDG